MISEIVFIAVIIIIGLIAVLGLIIGLKTNNNIKREDSLVARLRLELDLQIAKTKDLEKSQYDLLSKLQNLEYQLQTKDKQILQLLEKLASR